MAASKLSENKGMPGPAPAPLKPPPAIWLEIQQAVNDPDMIDEGDPRPSQAAVFALKEIIERTQTLLPTSMPRPHVELFEGSIRLIWSKPEANVRLVIGSADRRSYLYHEQVRNGLGANEELLDPTPENLANWLQMIQ